MEDLRWGAFVPQGVISEYAGWTPKDAWKRVRDFAGALDELGYEHLWVADHLESTPPHPQAAHFEAYSTLAALSQVTKRIRLGEMVTCASFRPAGMLAKQGACIDVFSGGRFILGLGAGWYEQEYRSYGYEFLPPGERIAYMEETLEAVTRLWSEDAVSLAGKYVRLEDAHCTPKPVQTLPPIWLGTHGRRKGLRVSARRADAINFNTDLETFKDLLGVLRRHCADVWRDYDEITKTVYRVAAIVDDENGFAKLVDGTPLAGAPYEQIKAAHFVGPLDHVIGQVQGFVDAGAREVIALFLDAHRTDASADQFIREVPGSIRAP